MLVVIAKILSTDKKDMEACKVFNTNTNKSELMSMRKIKDLVKGNTEIVGFKTSEICEYAKGKIRVNIVKERDKFRFDSVPEINGAEQLVNPEDAEKMVVYGWSGFAEMKKYSCVNYAGEITQLSVTEFEEAIKDKRINGATINAKTGKPVIMNALNAELV